MSRTTKVISVLLVLAMGLGVVMNRWRLTTGCGGDFDRLIIFHAGSLALPFQQTYEEFIPFRVVNSRELNHNLLL